MGTLNGIFCTYKCGPFGLFRQTLENQILEEDMDIVLEEEGRGMYIPTRSSFDGMYLRATTTTMTESSSKLILQLGIKAPSGLALASGVPN